MTKSPRAKFASAFGRGHSLVITHSSLVIPRRSLEHARRIRGCRKLILQARNLRRLLRGVLRLERGFRFVEDRVERGGVGYGEIGEDLAVEVDPGGFQALDESAVSQAICARGGVDALLPEHAEIALPGLAIAVGPILAFHHCILRVAEELRAAAAESAGFIGDFFAALPAGGSIGGSGHWFLFALFV